MELQKVVNQHCDWAYEFSPEDFLPVEMIFAIETM